MYSNRRLLCSKHSVQFPATTKIKTQKGAFAHLQCNLHSNNGHWSYPLGISKTFGNYRHNENHMPVSHSLATDFSIYCIYLFIYFCINCHSEFYRGPKENGRPNLIKEGNFLISHKSTTFFYLNTKIEIVQDCHQSTSCFINTIKPLHSKPDLHA